MEDLLKLLKPQGLDQEQIEAIALRVVQLQEQRNLIATQSKPAEEDPITTKDVLKLLGITEPTLRKRRLEGKVPYFKQGRHIYYFRSAILESLKQSQSTGSGRERRGYSRNSNSNGRRA